MGSGDIVDLAGPRKSIMVKDIIFIGILLTFASWLRFHYAVVLIGSDDYNTWGVASLLADGHWEDIKLLRTNNAVLRFGMSIPQAFIFRFFGVSSSSGVVFPFMFSLLGIVVAFDLARRLADSILAGYLAAIIVAANGLDLFGATVMLPDGPLAVASWTSIWIAVVALQTPPSRRTRRVVFFFLAGTLAGYAYAIKEPGIIVIIAHLTWLVSGLLFRKEFKWDALWILPGIVCVPCMEFAMAHYMFGHWNIRYLVAKHGQNESKELLARANIIKFDRSAVEIATATKDMLKLFVGHFPWTAFFLTAGAVTGFAVGALRLKSHTYRLFTILLAGYLAAKLLEFYGLYSYQPRRMLTLLIPSAVLIGILVVNVLRKLRLQGKAIFVVSAILVMAGLCLWGCFCDELKYAISQRQKINVERKFLEWIQVRRQLGDESPVFADSRTHTIMNVLSGFQILNLKTYVLPIDREQPFFVPLGENFYTESKIGYFLYNGRILDWYRNRKNIQVMQFQDSMTDSDMTLEAIIQSGNTRDDGAIFRNFGEISVPLSIDWRDESISKVLLWNGKQDIQVENEALVLRWDGTGNKPILTVILPENYRIRLVDGKGAGVRFEVTGQTESEAPMIMAFWIEGREPDRKVLSRYTAEAPNWQADRIVARTFVPIDSDYNKILFRFKPQEAGLYMISPLKVWVKTPKAEQDPPVDRGNTTGMN
jgi:hypothetical protein